MQTRYKYLAVAAIWGAMFALAPQGLAATGQRTVGQLFQLRLDHSSEEHGQDGSSSSDSGHDMLLEKVVGIGPDGVIFEYDLGPDVSKDERARQWQFPARVLRQPGQPPRLVNEAELVARVDPWLKVGKMTRAACGHWYFTWNAFRIDCDPKSALDQIAGLAMLPDRPTAGLNYADPLAIKAVPITLKASDSTGSVFSVELEVDPDIVRRGNAESDVVVGEILRKPVTLEQALAARSQEKISGKIMLEFHTEPAGWIVKRTRVTTIETTDAKGARKTRVANETLTRTFFEQ